MNGLVSFLSGLDLAPLYTIIQGLARDVAQFVSPTLLIIAIYTRTLETQLDSLVTGGRWAAALRDMAGWGVVLGLYGAIGYYLIDFMNSIYAWADSKGSLDVLMKTFSDILAKWSDKLSIKDLSVTNLLSTPVVLFTGLAYYLTLILATFVAMFLKVANVLVYGFAYIWGLIAIPMSITRTFALNRGWALLMGLSLLWPFVQAMFLAVFTVLFSNAANVIVADPDMNPALALSNVYMLFSVMHLLLIAVLIASPFIAQALVANAPAAAGVVTPFVGAAIAAGALTAKASEKAGGAVGGRIGSVFSARAAGAPAARTAGRSLAGVSSKNPPATSGLAADAQEGSATVAAPAPPAEAGVADKLRRQRQDRRNAIVRQQLRRR